MKKYIIAALFILLLLPTAIATNQVYEKATVSRLVGETPADIKNQLELENYNLQHATYFSKSDSFWKSIFGDKTHKQITNLLEAAFNGQITNRGLGWFTTSWGWDEVKNTVQAWSNRELFIITTEADKAITTLVKFRDNFVDSRLNPSDTISWSNKFASSHPLTIFNADYAGLYLPKNQDSYVDKLTKNGALIAPTAIPDSEFVKHIICNLNEDTLGKVYLNARNNYYWVTKRPSGLSLMSWSLYGLPYAEFSIPSDISSSVINDNCKGELSGDNYKSEIS